MYYISIIFMFKFYMVELITCTFYNIKSFYKLSSFYKLVTCFECKILIYKVVNYSFQMETE